LTEPQPPVPSVPASLPPVGVACTAYPPCL